MKTTKVFFYGTLKKGGYFFERYNLDLHAIRIDKAELKGYKLMQGAYPFVDFSAGDSVKGELHEYPLSMLDLFDMIEGHPYLYKRKELTVDVGSSLTKCWVYLPEDDYIMDGAERVEGDDYNVSN